MMKKRTCDLRHRLAEKEGFGLVELMIALLILSIGLLALAGVTAGVAVNTRLGAEETQQAMAARQVLERVSRDGFAAATSGTDTVVVSGRTYVVTRTVTDIGPRLKQVSAVVSGRGALAARTYTTRIYNPVGLPTP